MPGSQASDPINAHDAESLDQEGASLRVASGPSERGDQISESASSVTKRREEPPTPSATNGSAGTPSATPTMPMASGMGSGTKGALAGAIAAVGLILLLGMPFGLAAISLVAGGGLLGALFGVGSGNVQPAPPAVTSAISNSPDTRQPEAVADSRKLERNELAGPGHLSKELLELAEGIQAVTPANGAAGTPTREYECHDAPNDPQSQSASSSRSRAALAVLQRESLSESALAEPVEPPVFGPPNSDMREAAKLRKPLEIAFREVEHPYSNALASLAKQLDIDLPPQGGPTNPTGPTAPPLAGRDTGDVLEHVPTLDQSPVTGPRKLEGLVFTDRRDHAGLSPTPNNAHSQSVPSSRSNAALAVLQRESSPPSGLADPVEPPVFADHRDNAELSPTRKPQVSMIASPRPAEFKRQLSIEHPSASLYKHPLEPRTPPDASRSRG